MGLCIGDEHQVRTDSSTELTGWILSFGRGDVHSLHIMGRFWLDIARTHLMAQEKHRLCTKAQRVCGIHAFNVDRAYTPYGKCNRRRMHQPCPVCDTRHDST
jgi:hypothetical protein